MKGVDFQTLSFGIAGGVVLSKVFFFDGPFVWLDWCLVQAEIWKIQIAGLFDVDGSSELGFFSRVWSHLKAQVSLWQLLGLEKVHRVEVRKYSRAGIDIYGRLDPSLPHVDSLAARAKAREKLGVGTMVMKSGGMSSSPILRDVVLIGGGHSHAYVIKNFGMNPEPGVRLTLITRDVMTPYSGMLPGHVAGHYTREECHIDLVVLGRFANAVLIHSEAVGIDTENKLVLLGDGRPPVSYDVLSIDIGSTPSVAMSTSQSKVGDTPVTPVKPIDGFSARWDIILQRVLDSTKMTNLVVVGGGAGGCELCLSMQARLENELTKIKKDPSKMLNVSLLSRANVVMPSHAVATQQSMLKIMKQRGVNVHLGCEAERVDGSFIVCKNGKRIEADEILWCTQAGAAPWLQSVEGLDLDDNGFIKVNRRMETSVPLVFACGDIACLPDPRPKAGVFAVRAGPPVAYNIRAALHGMPRKKWTVYEPQKTFLGIIGTGLKDTCLASKGEMCLKASWLWDLKDWIDRKWMAGYTYALPVMNMDAGMKSMVAKAAGSEALDVLAHASMRCGGCGAKVGSTVLSQVMKRLSAPVSAGGFGGVPIRPEVLVGLDAPDDAAVVEAPRNKGGVEKVLVHTVDFFREVVNDPFLFGQIAANHSLSDCHAMNADAVSALAIAVVPFGMEEKVQHTLYQMMAGACKALKEAGCALVGGHTCEGPELSLGFAINGVADKDKVLSKGGMKAGQKIILTKPLGTGTIFAAEMRRQAQGAWWRSAVDSMLLSNLKAAKCLESHGATSCTDVTGFGLVGHLVEMLRGSTDDVLGAPATAEINLEEVPMLPGAVECVKKRIFSSLQPANVRLKRAITNENEAYNHPSGLYPLLFDPQTAGGLLASVPADKAESCVQALRKMGYKYAKVVGTVREERGEPGSGSNVVTII